MWGLAFLLLWIKGNQACWKVHGRGTSAPLTGLFTTVRVRFPAPAVEAQGFPGLGLTAHTSGEWQVGPLLVHTSSLVPGPLGDSKMEAPVCSRRQTRPSPGGGQGRLPSPHSPGYTPVLAICAVWRSENRLNFLIFPSSSKCRWPKFQSADGQCPVTPNFMIF